MGFLGWALNCDMCSVHTECQCHAKNFCSSPVDDECIQKWMVGVVIQKVRIKDISIWTCTSGQLDCFGERIRTVNNWPRGCTGVRIYLALRFIKQMTR